MKGLFYRIALEDITHPELGILVKQGDRVLTSSIYEDNDHESVVKVYTSFIFEISPEAFSTENVEQFNPKNVKW